MCLHRRGPAPRHRHRPAHLHKFLTACLMILERDLSSWNYERLSVRRTAHYRSWTSNHAIDKSQFLHNGATHTHQKKNVLNKPFNCKAFTGYIPLTYTDIVRFIRRTVYSISTQYTTKLSTVSSTPLRPLRPSKRKTATLPQASLGSSTHQNTIETWLHSWLSISRIRHDHPLEHGNRPADILQINECIQTIYHV